MANWSCIPRELVGLIANKFSAIEDYAGFAAVCRSYRFAAKGEKWCPVEASHQPPWLLLCCQDEDDDGGDCTQRGLLSMYRDGERFLMNLPELHGRCCWGTPYGWIVTLGFDKKLHLFNPLNRRRIVLADPHPDPEIWEDRDVRDSYIHRAMLIKMTPTRSSSFSASKDNDDFIVVTIDPAGDLKVMRGNTWVDVKFISLGMVREVICFKGQIYAVCHSGVLLIGSNFDDPAHPPTLDYFLDFDERFEGDVTEQYYIVESLGELLMIVRHIDKIDGNDYYSVSYFDAFKMNFETKEWIEIEDDLGDCALFVGGGQSISILQPENYNCRSNCIYFTDDNYEFFFDKKGGKDMGIYDFEEQTVEYFYQGEDSLSTYSTPTWFIPTIT